MKPYFHILNFVIRFIAIFVFASGVLLTGLGAYDFFHAFSHFNSPSGMVGLFAVGLLQSVDLFLMAVVFFVFSIGILILFNTHGESDLNLPNWLQIKNFTQLKVILWEAILTTLLVSYIGGLVYKRLDGEQPTVYTLVIPAAILLLSISLFLMKKGEH
jgi:uncharacterized membrane protein YqhA